MAEATEISAIVNCLNLYAIAVDSQCWDLFDQVFTEDITADFGGQAVWKGRTDLKAAFAMIHESFASTQHVTTNHHVSVSGNDASSISYVHGRFIRTVPQGGSMFESTGWYEDRLVRHPEGWRIARRSCRMQWWGGNPAVLETAPGVKVDPVLDSMKDHAASPAGIAHIASLLNGA
ncbi:nuclear transport factor 2 family protein [Novosphingobium aquae]|uniref:Nuclear transport factor 2 family protein n=1 Tax=Novosphingobium aquae TaxID=3133435 RepID=A0ABU8S7R2_9SPHN